MAKDGGGNFDWSEDAECAKKINKEKVDLFFSYEYAERHEAKNLCFSCPVRKECLKWALENKEIWGIWGGRDEDEIRRTLSVNVEGAEVRRSRYPICPFCSANTSKLVAKIVDKPGGGRWTTMRMVECSECGFEWRSRTSANAVKAYFAEKAAKELKRKKGTPAPTLFDDSILDSPEGEDQ